MRPFEMKAGAEVIKDTIQKVMRSLEGKEKASSADDPRRLLKEILKKKEFLHLKGHYFKKGVLNLEVDSAAWLYQLNLQKEGLLNNLRNKASVAIKDIRFYLGDKG